MCRSQLATFQMFLQGGVFDNTESSSTLTSAYVFENVLMLLKSKSVQDRFNQTHMVPFHSSTKSDCEGSSHTSSIRLPQTTRIVATTMLFLRVDKMITDTGFLQD